MGCDARALSEAPLALVFAEVHGVKEASASNTNNIVTTCPTTILQRWWCLTALAGPGDSRDGRLAIRAHQSPLNFRAVGEVHHWAKTFIAVRTSSVAPGKPKRRRVSPRPEPGSSKSTPGVIATPASSRSASQNASESRTPCDLRSAYSQPVHYDLPICLVPEGKQDDAMHSEDR
eukprot:scaffold213643_cov31-Tisochrysis_lutea.AAC.4